MLARFYWTRRGKSFPLEAAGYQARIYPQHFWAKSILRTLEYKSFLEIGCGFGRNIDFFAREGLLNGKEVLGIDFSPTMLDNYICDRKQFPVMLGNAQRLPVRRNYDVVFIHGVFMHIPPGRVLKAVSEMVRVAEKYVIQIEEISAKKLINTFTYSHDYISFYYSKFEMVDIKVKDNLLWLFLKKKIV
jgi:SAM-dependent methyltransferase